MSTAPSFAGDSPRQKTSSAAHASGASIILVALIFGGGSAFASLFWSDKIALAAAGAREVSPQQAPELHGIVDRLCALADMDKPRVAISPARMPNAFATGRNSKNSVLCVTEGLLYHSGLTQEELEGVLAHEFSHIRNKDMLLMTLAVVLAGFVAIAANIFLRVSFYGGARRNDNGNGNAIVLVLAIIGLILAPIAAQLIQLAISRRREYLADASGALLTRYPEGLASALEKLGAYQAPMRNANLATSHLFINDPFGKHPSGSGWVEKLFSTHPPIQSRIQALLGK